MSEFKLPPDATFPLEVETVGGNRAWIDSKEGVGKYPLLGRIAYEDGQERETWTLQGLAIFGDMEHSNYNLKPMVGDYEH